MEQNLSPATEATLNELAQRTSRAADELMDEAVQHLAAYDEWLQHKMKPRIEAVERGEAKIVSNVAVRAWLERQEQREQRERS